MTYCYYDEAAEVSVPAFLALALELDMRRHRNEMDALCDLMWRKRAWRLQFHELWRLKHCTPEGRAAAADESRP